MNTNTDNTSRVDRAVNKLQEASDGKLDQFNTKNLFLSFRAKLQLSSKTMEKCKQRHAMKQKL